MAIDYEYLGHQIKVRLWREARNGRDELNLKDDIGIPEGISWPTPVVVAKYLKDKEELEIVSENPWVVKLTKRGKLYCDGKLSPAVPEVVERPMPIEKENMLIYYAELHESSRTINSGSVAGGALQSRIREVKNAIEQIDISRAQENTNKALQVAKRARNTEWIAAGIMLLGIIVHAIIAIFVKGGGG